MVREILEIPMLVAHSCNPLLGFTGISFLSSSAFAALCLSLAVRGPSIAHRGSVSDP